LISLVFAQKYKRGKKSSREWDVTYFGDRCPSPIDTECDCAYTRDACDCDACDYDGDACDCSECDDCSDISSGYDGDSCYDEKKPTDQKCHAVVKDTLARASDRLTSQLKWYEENIKRSIGNFLDSSKSKIDTLSLTGDVSYDTELAEVIAKEPSKLKNLGSDMQRIYDANMKKLTGEAKKIISGSLTEIKKQLDRMCDTDKPKFVSGGSITALINSSTESARHKVDELVSAMIGEQCRKLESVAQSITDSTKRAEVIKTGREKLNALKEDIVKGAKAAITSVQAEIVPQDPSNAGDKTDLLSQLTAQLEGEKKNSAEAFENVIKDLKQGILLDVFGESPLQEEESKPDV